MMGLPYGEEIMIVGRTMWTQSTSVRQTDRQTDRITITKTVQCRASHGKNWSTLAKVILKIKLACFLWPTVYIQWMLSTDLELNWLGLDPWQSEPHQKHMCL